MWGVYIDCMDQLWRVSGFTPGDVSFGPNGRVVHLGEVCELGRLVQAQYGKSYSRHFEVLWMFFWYLVICGYTKLYSMF